MKALAYVLAATAVTMGCGGATTTPLLDGGAGGGADATTGGDAGPDALPGSEAGPDCGKLLADLEAKRQAAVQCCATCNSLQCGQQIDGLCCPLTVTSGDSTAARQYKLALEAVKSASCTVSCPATPCATQPSGTCLNGGTCQQ